MTLSIEKQESLIRRSMELASDAIVNGDRPFAAILIDQNGSIILEAVNTVNSTNNAAAHAEINLLFKAGQILQTRDLSNFALVSNAASCPMCATALIKAKIANFYYGAPNEYTMVPNITMIDVFDTVPFEIEVHGGILASECITQIKSLTTN